MYEMDGSACTQDKVDADNHEPKEALDVSAGGDAEESNGKGDLAPAGGEDGKEAGDVAEEEDVVEIFGRDLVVVLAVSKGGADGEKGTVGGESELHPGKVQLARRNLSTMEGVAFMAMCPPCSNIAYPAQHQDAVIPPDRSSPPYFAVDS